MASLLLISPQQLMDGLAVLANPAHFTLFGWSGEQSWWFYGKNELLFGVATGVLEQRLAGASMLITRRGSWLHGSGCDKAVLLHVLLEHLHGLGRIRTLLLADHSLVLGPGGAFCTTRMAFVESPDVDSMAGSAFVLH